MSEKFVLNIKQVIAEVLKDSNYSRSLFTDIEIQSLGEDFYIQMADNTEIALSAVSQTDSDIQTLDKKKYLVYCPIRNKNFNLKPEELIRQLYVRRLLNEKDNENGYGYPKNRIKVEYTVSMGRAKKSADIVILNKNDRNAVDIIVEVKKPKLKEGKDQLRSYCNATGATMGVWTNGEKSSHYHRRPPNHFVDIANIPNANESLEDILQESFTIKELIRNDILTKNRKTLKEVITDLEEEVLANAGVDVFEEVFKLIFTKLYDEYESRKNKDYIDERLQEGVDIVDIPNTRFRKMQFRNTGQDDRELREKIQELFEKAKNVWQDVFSDDSEFELTDSHLAICVSSLQDVKLFNSNLVILDEAFEYLVTHAAKGEKGQYFTPRHVIDMCVLMLNPKRGEYMIDTAAGSCGFPVHTIFNLTGNLFTNKGISEEYEEDIHKIFGIDFDEKTVRVARTLNLIAGDGKSNVLRLNTLNYERWNEQVGNRNWLNTYNEGFRRLERLRVDRNDNSRFKFDLLMANPPFAGAIKENHILELYDLAKDNRSVPKDQVARDILFIERNLDFIKPGGRMAIVLPQGRLNNITNKYIREFIADQARILAVVELGENTFKPHTPTKTSVLFLKKWNNNPNDKSYFPQEEDYSIFFAVSEKSGKDTSGNYTFLKNDDDQYELDKNGHLIVDHDLHNHDSKLDDGIAEHFIKWAKSEGLSFWA